MAKVSSPIPLKVGDPGAAKAALPLATHPYHGYCRCGACVWDCPEASQAPRYSEQIICWNCGRDCSRRDFPGYHVWRLGRDQRLLRKRGCLALRQRLGKAYPHLRGVVLLLTFAGWAAVLGWLLWH